MALGGAPKTVGHRWTPKNTSTRKRLNHKKPATNSLLDLLGDCNDQLKQSLNQNDVPPMQISTANHVFQIMLCINHPLLNKIISSHRYKETVSFLNR